MPLVCYIPNFYMQNCDCFYLVLVLLHCTGNLLARVAALLMASSSELSRTRDVDARTGDLNLLVVGSIRRKLSFFSLIGNTDVDLQAAYELVDICLESCGGRFAVLYGGFFMSTASCGNQLR